jgi:hypothetical protein
VTSIVTDFRSIKRKFDRMEQKAEFEAKNPVPEPGMYGWPYGVAVPYAEPFDWKPVLDAWGVKI